MTRWHREKQVLVILAMVLLSFTLWGCGGPRNVTVETLQEAEVPISWSTDAPVKALHKDVVKPKVSGRITSFAVKVGDTVRAGQVLATIDTTELQARLAQAQAAPVATTPIVSDQGEVERARELLASGVITTKEFQRIQARYGVAPMPTSGGVPAAAVATLQTQIANATITAPMAGVVTAIYNEDRKVAIQDRPLFMIQQAGPMVATLTIPKSVAAVLRVPAERERTTVTITTDKGIVHGLITDVEPDSAAPATLMKVTFDDANHWLTPGTFYAVQIQSPAKARLPLIPSQAVHTLDKEQIVYVLTADNHVDVRPVVVAELVDMPEKRMVVSGLTSGDRIITTPGTFTLGELVRPRP